MHSSTSIVPHPPPANLDSDAPLGALYDWLQLLGTHGGVAGPLVVVAGIDNTDALAELLEDPVAFIGVRDDRALTVLDIDRLVVAGAHDLIFWWPPDETPAGQTLEHVAALASAAGAAASTVRPGSRNPAHIKAHALNPAKVISEVIQQSEQITGTDRDPTSSQSAGGVDWPPLGRPDLPPFPLEAFPPGLQLAAEAIANEAQTSPDVAAVSMLGVLSAAGLGARIDVAGTWQEEACLYLMVALPTGEHKTAVLNRIATPLRRIEQRIRDEARDTVRQSRTRLETLTEGRKQLVKKIGTSDNDDIRADAQQELNEIDSAIAEIGDPAEPRIFVDNITPETLGARLATHKRLAIVVSEGTFIENTLGRYDSKGNPNLGIVKLAYSGEATIVDRQRGTERLERPLLTILIVAQEDVLRAVVEHPAARGEGLVNRFAFSMPSTRVGYRDMRPDPAPATSLEAWAAAVERVYNVVSVIGSGDVSFSLSAQALDRLDAYRGEQEIGLREDGELHHVGELVVHRNPGLAVRIALALHLCDAAAGTPISAETMDRGIRIARYFLAHGAAAVTQPDPAVRRALRWLAKQNRSSITGRDLNRGPFQRMSLEDRLVLVEKLCKLGALHAVEATDEARPRKRGRPSDIYLVSPELLTGSEAHR